MFSPSGSFKAIPCPHGRSCTAFNCMFQHEAENDAMQPPPQKRRRIIADSKIDAQIPSDLDAIDDVPDRKDEERKIPQASSTIISRTVSPPPVKRQQMRPTTTVTTTRRAETSTLPTAPLHKPAIANGVTTTPHTKTSVIPPAPIEKPALTNGATTSKIASTFAKPRSISKAITPIKPAPKAIESLNPRLIKHDPAGHATRTLYLKTLHGNMVRVNDEVRRSSDEAIKQLAKTDAELITMALDEEAKMATESPLVYANVIKQRMMLYKKMTVEQWKSLCLEEKTKSGKVVADGKSTASINTGMTRDQELESLRLLIANQIKLPRYGYVISPPTSTEIKAAQDGLAAAVGWEVCERCTVRFQVFPERREDGALTTGGKCTHHHGRKGWRERSADDAGKGPREQMWTCCGQAVSQGTLGCTTGETHVFKVGDAKRLAAVLQFERTPENPNLTEKGAVSFDCEMGYTVFGMELIRLTAVSWPEGEELLDVLVRPLGTILDLNSRYSGVYPEHFLRAQPYTPENLHKGDDKIPRIVDSPMAARALLFSHISPDTVLIGHAIENDLNTTRIVHPNIVDTVLLFPVSSGLPYRPALKTLAKQHLSRDIQMGGASGHDSKEDAIATGELVRVKVAQKWKQQNLK